jgi:hypothetical protein
VSLVEAIENNLGRKPEQASADSGYCSEPNLKALVARGIDGYVALGRAQHPTAANGKVGGPLTRLMRKKIDVNVISPAPILSRARAGVETFLAHALLRRRLLHWLKRVRRVPC